jgi:hypothetical protein
MRRSLEAWGKQVLRCAQDDKDFFVQIKLGNAMQGLDVALSALGVTLQLEDEMRRL